VIIKLNEQVLGSAHPRTLACYYEFAVDLQRAGKTEQAEQFGRRAAQGATKSLGPSHPVTHKYVAFVNGLQAKR
jgi:hypothetical protein